MRRESFVNNLSAVGAALVIGVAASACGGSPSGGGDFGGAGWGGSGSGSSSGSGSFGGADAASAACVQAGQTRACGACNDGTQTCVAQTSGETTSLSWGPCSGAQMNCGPSNGGGGNEDGGVGNGGGGAEDGGGNGGGGGGHEDAGGGGNGGGGGETVDAGPPPSCSGDLNSEPDILAAYEPADGGSVSNGGQIKVWVTDECAPTIAPGEQVSPTTGAITAPGEVTALAPDGYPYEPVLYIGGAAYIPSAIKGAFNASPNTDQCAGLLGAPNSGPPIDPCPVSLQPGFQNAEYVWDVSSLGLAPGTYAAEFVIHDGDQDRAIGCVTIVIQ